MPNQTLQATRDGADALSRSTSLWSRVPEFCR